MNSDPSVLAVRTLLHGRRRSLLINGVIVLALALVVLTTWRSVRSDDAEAATPTQTAKVDTGEVTATVSASGNVDAASSTDVSFEGNGGTVDKVFVAAGDVVKEGQALAEVDQTSARQALASAKAQLDSAEASYETAVAGRTGAEQAQDAQTVSASAASVHSAELQVTAAKQSGALTRKQQDAAVARAEDAVRSASGDGRTEAQAALVQARQERETQLLQAQQSIASAQDQVRSAQAQLASTKAQVAVNAEGPTDGEVAGAQAQVDSAEVGVEEAQTTLQQTVLRAPVAGTVASVNGSVGASSSSTSSAATSTDTTTTSSSSGFITLTAADTLEVTAYVAEADIDDVAVGQSATVTLSASDTDVTGEVTAIDTEPTVTNNVVEYGVTVRLDSADGVRIGATAQLVISTGDKQDVTRVSSSALTTIGQRTTATVEADDGTTQTVSVTVGLVGDNQTEVLDGLTPGDTVVVPQTAASTDTGFTFPGAGGGLPGGGVGR